MGLTRCQLTRLGGMDPLSYIADERGPPPITYTLRPVTLGIATRGFPPASLGPAKLPAPDGQKGSMGRWAAGSFKKLSCHSVLQARSQNCCVLKLTSIRQTRTNKREV